MRRMNAPQRSGARSEDFGDLSHLRWRLLDVEDISRGDRRQVKRRHGNCAARAHSFDQRVNHGIRAAFNVP